MANRTLVLWVLSLCFVVINCGHVTVLEDILGKSEANVVEAGKPTEDDCRPKATYVKWSEVRDYLNEYYKLHLPLSVSGVPLTVMRCRHYLAPCMDEKTYCGVEKESKRKVRIPLEHNSKKIGVVVVEFLEDEHCKCVSKKWYDLVAYQDAAAAPVVLDAFIIKY